MVAPNAAAACAYRKRQYINRFIEIGAITEENAKTLNELNIVKNVIFRSMLRDKIVIQTESKRYYLNRGYDQKTFLMQSISRRFPWIFM